MPKCRPLTPASVEGFMKEHVLKVITKKIAAPNVIELEAKLVKPKSINFRAGQFMFFYIGGAYKAYSITSLPKEKDHLAFLVKLEPGGRGSNFVKALKIGDQFIATGPEGNFFVTERTKNLCMVAAGIGIAPFVSIIPDLLNKNFSGQIELIYGHKNPEDFLHKMLWEKLGKKHKNFKIIEILNPSINLRPYLDINYQKSQNSVFYICGSQDAVESINGILAEKQHDSESIKTETFLV